MHSVFSDGTHTPEELIELAAEQDLKAVALTDHDTVKGAERYLKAAKDKGIQGIAGVEVSTSWTAGEMHILGYFLEYKDPFFASQLEWIRTARHARNEEILHKLHKMGMHLSWSEIKKVAGDDVVGRPHFARAMMARGYVKNAKEAFTRYLAKGCPAYAPRRTLSAEEALEVILGANGVPVLAHPFTLDLNRLSLRELVEELVGMGLGGIETYYPAHDRDQTREFLHLTKDFNLVPTGGTDFHGAHTPDLQMGRGFGSLRVPDDVVERLYAKRPNG